MAWVVVLLEPPVFQGSCAQKQAAEECELEELAAGVAAEGFNERILPRCSGFNVALACGGACEAARLSVTASRTEQPIASRGYSLLAERRQGLYKCGTAFRLGVHPCTTSLGARRWLDINPHDP